MLFTRPSSQDQDQDQCYKIKTTARKTKTEFYWSETGLATSQSLRPHCCRQRRWAAADYSWI